MIRSVLPLVLQSMPRYFPNSRISDCWGSAGDVTFYHRDGVCYYRKKPVMEFAGTPGQMEQVGIHQRALEAWRGLDHAVQLEWNVFAGDVPSKRPPYDKNARISGYNLFVSAYHGFALLGDEKVPEPAKFIDFPVFSLGFKSVEVDESGEMRLKCLVTQQDVEDFTRYRVLAKIQLARAGAGRRPGLMRNFLADENCSAKHSTVMFSIADYVGLAGEALREYQVHMRYILVDTLTGYRSRHKSKSFVISM